MRRLALMAVVVLTVGVGRRSADAQDIPPFDPPHDFPAPANIRLQTDLSDEAAYLSWDYDLTLTSDFFVTVTYPHPGGGTITENLPGDPLRVVVPRAFAQICGDPPGYIYRVASSVNSAVRSEFGELAGGTVLDVSCVTFAARSPSPLVAPASGHGATVGRRRGDVGLALLILGVVVVSCGIIARRRPTPR